MLGHLPERGQPQWGCSAWWQQHEATGAVSNRRPAQASAQCCNRLLRRPPPPNRTHRPFSPPLVSAGPTASSLTSRCRKWWSSFFWWPVLFFPIPPGSGLQESKESHRFEVQRSQRWTRLSRNLRACLRRLNVIDYTSQATDQMRSSSPAVGSRPKAETAWVVKNWSFLGGKELWKCVSKRHDSTHTARACPPPVLSFLLLNVLFRCVDSLAGRC